MLISHKHTHIDIHKHTHKAHSTFKVLVSMKVSDNPFFKTIPLFTILPTPPFLWKKLETLPPLYWESGVLTMS